MKSELDYFGDFKYELNPYFSLKTSIGWYKYEQ